MGHESVRMKCITHQHEMALSVQLGGGELSRHDYNNVTIKTKRLELSILPMIKVKQPFHMGNENLEQLLSLWTDPKAGVDDESEHEGRPPTWRSANVSWVFTPT